jgi:O-succinylhomoserine sulfhydrylase
VATSHAKLTDAQRAELGVTPSLMRLSVGIEDTNDLIADIEQALV